MTFLIFVIAAIAYLVLYTRQSAILSKIDSLDKSLRSRDSFSRSSSPVHGLGHAEEKANEWSDIANNGLNISGQGAISMGKAPFPAPAPAPAPSPDYYATEQSVGTQAPAPHQVDENQEEKSARWLGRIGGFMVFLGMAFFVNYAINVGWLTPPGQFILGILVGIIMLAVGHYLRVSHLGNMAYEKYATGLLGGGIAVLYLIIFAGFSILHYANDGGPIISQTIAFSLMILVTAIAMVLSVVSNSRFLAISAVLGGFITPVLVSTGENHLVTLALYIAILNAGVIGVGWFNKWSWLNYGAMFGTVVLFSGWMEKFYWRDPDGQLMLTFFFITIFFVQFLVTAVLHHFRSNEESTSTDFVFLSLNSGLYFIAAYSILFERHENLLGFLALILALVHLGVAFVSYTSTLRDRKLNLFLVGIAVVFLSIAVPLQLSGYWIGLSWLVESVVLIGIGAYLREYVLNIFGWILFVFGMSSVVDDVASIRSGFGVNGGYYQGVNVPDFTPFVNSAFLILVMAVISVYAIGYAYAKFECGGKWKQVLLGTVIVANILSLYAVTSEISLLYDKQIRVTQLSAAKVSDSNNAYQGNLSALYNSDYYSEQIKITSETAAEVKALNNQKSTVTSIFWALYAILLLFFGFMKRVRELRIGGLILIFLTFGKVFLMVWGLGQPYPIIASFVFGVLALAASFSYVKYKHLLKEIIYEDGK